MQAVIGRDSTLDQISKRYVLGTGMFDNMMLTVYKCMRQSAAYNGASKKTKEHGKKNT